MQLSEGKKSKDELHKVLDRATKKKSRGLIVVASMNNASPCFFLFWFFLLTVVKPRLNIIERNFSCLKLSISDQKAALKCFISPLYLTLCLKIAF